MLVLRRKQPHGQESGVSQSRLEDRDILLDGAAAYANAGDHLTLAGERRPAPIAQYLPPETAISGKSSCPGCTSGSRSIVRIPTNANSMEKAGAPLMRCWRTMLPWMSITQTATGTLTREPSSSTRSATLFANVSKSMLGVLFQAAERGDQVQRAERGDQGVNLSRPGRQPLSGRAARHTMPGVFLRLQAYETWGSHNRNAPPSQITARSS